MLDILVATALYARSARSAGYQSCTTLYVADVSAPSLVSAPSTTVLATLLSGETAANFFGDDILDVAQSRSVAAYVSRTLPGTALLTAFPHSSFSDINGSITGNRLDRTVNLCVTNPSSVTAQAAAGALATAMTSQRKRFIGSQMAHRTFVTVVSAPDVNPAPVSRSLLSFGLRIFLGVLLALALALLWDVLDPRVRDAEDVRRALDAPVLASSR